MSFGGLLASALGQGIQQQTQAEQASRAKQAEMQAELQMYGAKKEIDAGYDAQAAQAEQARNVEALRQNRERLESIVGTLPAEQQNDPIAIGNAIARSGDTELAKSFMDVAKVHAETGATRALEEQRMAYADNDTRNTNSQIAERGRSSAPGLIGGAMGGGFDPQSTQGKIAADLVASGVVPDIQAAMRIASEDSRRGDAVRIVMQNPHIMGMPSPEVARLVNETMARLGSTGTAPAPNPATLDVDSLFPAR